jgi:TPR repeat protein
MTTTLRALLLAAVGAVALSASAVAQTPAGRYRVTLDDGSIVDVEANSPDEAMEMAKRRIDDEDLKKTRPPAEIAHRLAEKGYAWAQYELGVMYANGRIVPQNYAEAVRWYRLAADQGDRWAQTNLGAMYDQGEGVTQNYVEAVRLYRLAADQGFSLAQSRLGLMYANGEGVSQNDVEAYKWLALAAAQQGIHAGARDAVRRRMTPAQIAEGQRLAAEWKPKK